MWFAPSTFSPRHPSNERQRISNDDTEEEEEEYSSEQQVL